MSRFAFRGAAVPALLAAGLVSALTAAPAFAQQEGDQVVLVLTSGKKFSGTLVSRNDAEVKIRVGKSEVGLPASMVATVEKVETEAEAETPPAEEPAEEGAAPEASTTPTAPTTTPRRGPAKGRTPAEKRLQTRVVRPERREKPPEESAPAPGAASEDDNGEPKQACLMLKDGTVIEGFVLAKADGRIWVVPGAAVVVEESDIEESYGQTEPLSGAAKGITFSGDVNKDAARMIEELGSGERSRIIAAKAVLWGLGTDAIPALILGLKSRDAAARMECLTRLQEVNAVAAVEPITSLLRNDPDPAVRARAAARLGEWDPAGIRRVILEAVWRDPVEAVKVSGLMGLEKTAGPEEASALIDLLAILPGDSKAYPALFRCLRKATGLALGEDSTVWNAWWDDGGRERMAQKAEVIAENRRRQEDARAFGGPVQEQAPTGTPGGGPEPPKPIQPEAPAGGPPGTPPVGPEGGPR